MNVAKEVGMSKTRTFLSMLLIGCLIAGMATLAGCIDDNEGGG